MPPVERLDRVSPGDPLTAVGAMLRDGLAARRADGHPAAATELRAAVTALLAEPAASSGRRCDLFAEGIRVAGDLLDDEARYLLLAPTCCTASGCVGNAAARTLAGSSTRLRSCSRRWAWTRSRGAPGPNCGPAATGSASASIHRTTT